MGIQCHLLLTLPQQYPLLVRILTISHLPLQEPQIDLKGYTSHEVKLLGQVDVAVKYGDQEKVLPLVIAKGNRTSLFGRSWM